MNAATLRNATALPVDSVPVSAMNVFRTDVIEAISAGGRLSALFGDPGADGVTLWAVIAHADRGELSLLRARPFTGSYPALTPDCPRAHLFERELAEQFGLRPQGHPWLQPVRGEYPWNQGPWKQRPTPGLARFRLAGVEPHEVAVGPVHAGVIEPGHFRFQCHGEHVYNLEIVLGYQHRGLEKELIGGPYPRTPFQLETAAGDATAAHAWAWCGAIEALSGVSVPPRAQQLRGLALELERLANHTGDLGALAGDVGFLPVAAFGGRIRGDFLNLTAELCGSRLGRGLFRPGGVAFDLDAERAGRMSTRLAAARRDLAGAVELLWKTPSVLARFERTGVVRAEDARAAGLVGPAARACGVDLDVRRDFATGPWETTAARVSLAAGGDVAARARVRSREVEVSGALVEDWLRALPAGPIRAPVRPLAPRHLAVSLVEGWRGETVHVVRTDTEGHFGRYKIVDPSFHNWFGLSLALRDEQISDFPLCNKSFNLSYCGHDL